MSLKLLVDMNLTPERVRTFQEQGWDAVHWSAFDDPGATDSEIMQWAAAHDYVVFTHDLDFGTMLALSHRSGPSVIPIRAEDVLPDNLGRQVVAALSQHEVDLSSGSLVVVYERRSRVRVLPL